MNRKISARFALGLIAGLCFLVWGFMSLPQWIASLRPEPKVKIIISLEQYKKIKEGMTISEVQAVVGSPGEIMGAGSNSNTQWVRYSWKNRPLVTYASINFINGRVTQREQQGLE
ncbi:hypothetical protein [Armatimonas sp.]|uniref:hypothetical protein n=1 Tax=Armatimonas sp. TaxID=1872638 RepID=UPI0037535040